MTASDILHYLMLFLILSVLLPHVSPHLCGSAKEFTALWVCGFWPVNLVATCVYRSQNILITSLILKLYIMLVIDSHWSIECVPKILNKMKRDNPHQSVKTKRHYMDDGIKLSWFVGVWTGLDMLSSWAYTIVLHATRLLQCRGKARIKVFSF